VTIRTLIETFTATGQSYAAAVLHGALDASPTATPVTGADAVRMDDVLGRLRADLGPDALAAARIQGAALGDPGAVAFALATLREDQQPGTEP
jgi:hypothetical protein